METVFFIFEIIGVFAFSLSGAMIAAEKKMDIFGIFIVGLTTALGGGVFRDLVLGNNPPAMFQSPIYAVIALFSSCLVFSPNLIKSVSIDNHIEAKILLVFDSIGLGIFTVVGIRIAVLSGFGDNRFLLGFVGLVTGVGGGVLRDLFVGERPYIFVKHFYASASLLGALLCIFLWDPLGEALSMLLGASLIFVLRLLAAKYRWSLPKPDGWRKE